MFPKFPAASPQTTFPPLFNRYDAGMRSAVHAGDAAARILSDHDKRDDNGRSMTVEPDAAILQRPRGFSEHAAMCRPHRLDRQRQWIGIRFSRLYRPNMRQGTYACRVLCELAHRP